MKKIYRVILFVCVVFLFTFLFSNVRIKADTGPKPYVTIEIKGNTQGYYMTLLAKSESSGPYSSNEEYHEDMDAIDVKFNTYSKGDEFYYWFVYESIEDGEFHWGYYPPSTFKILIYDSINDRFITDNKEYTRESFETLLKLTLNNGGEVPFTVTKSSNYTLKIILGFVLRLMICLGIELGVAFLFKFKKKQYLVIIGANILTQVVLNSILASIIYSLGMSYWLIIPVYIFLEVAILFVEWLLYVLFINKVNKDNVMAGYKLFLYSLSANAASLVLGFEILNIIGF